MPTIQQPSAPRRRRNRFSRGSERLQIETSEEDATLLWHLLQLGFATVGALILLRLLGRSSTRHTYTRLARLHRAGYLTRLPRTTSSAIPSGTLSDLLTVEAGRAGVQADAGAFLDDMTEQERGRWLRLARSDSKRIVDLLTSYGRDGERVKKRLRQNADNADKVLTATWNTSEHALLASNVVAMLAYAAVSGGRSIEEIRGDNQLDLRATYTPSSGTAEKILRTPDALLVIRDGSALDVLLIEAETGKASRGKVKEKLVSYKKLVDAAGGYDAFRRVVGKATDLDPEAVRSVRVILYCATDAHADNVADELSILWPTCKSGQFFVVPASRANLDIPSNTLRKNLVVPGTALRVRDYYKQVFHGDVAGVVYGRLSGPDGEYADVRYGPLFTFPPASEEPETDDAAA